MVIEHQMKRFGSAFINGAISLAIGHDDLGLIQFSPDTTIDKDLRVNIVVTMHDGKITTMQEYRRAAKARRAANIAA